MGIAVRIGLCLAALVICSCGRVDFEDHGGDAARVVDSGTDGSAVDGARDADAGGALDSATTSPDGGPDAGRMVRITVLSSGPGTGTVTSASGAPPMSCGATCSIDVPVGSDVTLTPTAAGDSWFEGWGPGPCSGRWACSFTATIDVSAEARFTALPNRVFVSSTTHDGNFGGLAGADGLCDTLAMTAGMPGTWIALLGTASATSFSRLGTARGFVRVDGEPVGDGSLDRALWYPIRLDENGVDVGAADFWGASGASSLGDLCADWTTNVSTTVGRVQQADRGWNLRNGGGDWSCDRRYRFLCVETGRTVAIAPSPTAGRGSFVTTGEWIPSTGLAAADAVCAGEAMAESRGGSYRAFLADVGAPGMARFSDGLPWVRDDGMPLLATRGAWATASSLDVAPALGPDGRPHVFRIMATGGMGLGGAGTALTTCGGWSTTTGTFAACLRTWDTGALCGGGQICSSPIRLLCLEE